MYAASSALPGPDGFPPFPPDQEMHEEGFSASENGQPEFPEPPQPPEDFNQENNKPENPNPDNQNPELPEGEEPIAPPPPLPPKDADKIFYYRGNRTYSEELPLKVNFIRCMRGENGEIILMIVFNQSVNPRSVKNESFLIDDTELPANIRFSFNKKGDTIRVVIPQDDEEFRVTVQDVSTFSGAELEPVEIIAKVED
ncbi:MAG: hypothetical protein J5710_05880 [Treponema sp.]|nr:hypothetical protein [Treponema sp.]